MSAPRVHITIIVYKASPDYQKYRHTAIWVRNASSAILTHVVGPSGEFAFEARAASNPADSTRFAKAIDVGYLTSAITLAQVVFTMQQIPISNSDREFNCQIWVERALKKLRDMNELSNEDYERSIDGMVDAIAEAEDEE